MPLYEYECRSCGERTETLQRLDEAPLTTCPQCGGPLKKLISAPGFHFKGSGWYVTDYARSKAGSTKAGGAAAEAPAEGKTTAKEKDSSAAKPAGDAPAKSASS